jgi:hypothetical protein
VRGIGERREARGERRKARGGGGRHARWRVRWLLMDDVREFLADRDAACPRCGYNLRGSAGTACPECGRRVSMRELLAEEDFRAWRERRMPGDPVTRWGLVGSILGIGLPGSLVVLGALLRGAPGLTEVKFAALVAVFVVQLGLASMYLRELTRMKAWPRRRKLAMAVLAWCWGPAALLMIVVMT